MVEFGGWEMPLQYPTRHHRRAPGDAQAAPASSTCRTWAASCCAVPSALPFLQHVLTNNAAASTSVQAQYTIVPTADGRRRRRRLPLPLRTRTSTCWSSTPPTGTRTGSTSRAHLRPLPPTSSSSDATGEIAMLALQGPRSRDILAALSTTGGLPEPLRNELSIATCSSAAALAVRRDRPHRLHRRAALLRALRGRASTGRRSGTRSSAAGAEPVGLGARDTLRLEAGLPLYGHELGARPRGRRDPRLRLPAGARSRSASRRSRATSSAAQPLRAPARGLRAHPGARLLAARRPAAADAARGRDRPRHRPRGRRRCCTRRRATRSAGSRSGTAVPYWGIEGEGLVLARRPTSTSCAPSPWPTSTAACSRTTRSRSTCAAAASRAVVVPYHLRSDAPPCARADRLGPRRRSSSELRGRRGRREGAAGCSTSAIANHDWRQDRVHQPHPLGDDGLAAGAPALDHGPVLPLRRAQEGRGLLRRRRLLLPGHRLHPRGRAPARAASCAPTWAAPRSRRASISGQMANTAVFSAMVDYLNRADRKAEPRRIAQGHEQPHRQGRPPERPADGRPARLRRPRPAHRAAGRRQLPGAAPTTRTRPTSPALLELIEQQRPELIIFGKSMVLHPEPVGEVRALPRRTRHRRRRSCTTWPTCSGLRRAALPAAVRRGRRPRHRLDAQDVLRHAARRRRRPLRRDRGAATTSGRRSQRRTFPGSVSNHHLGTLLGLLMAAYEMNHFKDAYQPAVIANAKAFARALHDAGLRRRRRPGRRLHRDPPGRGARSATAAARRSPAASRTTTSSATTRRRPTRRASPPPAPCAWASPR